MQFVFHLREEQGEYSSLQLIKLEPLKLQNASPHNSTGRKAEGKQNEQKRDQGPEIEMTGSTMACGDGVINHLFSIKLHFPCKHIMECAEGLFAKRDLVQKCEKLNFISRTGCQDMSEGFTSRRKGSKGGTWTVCVQPGAGLGVSHLTAKASLRAFCLEALSVGGVSCQARASGYQLTPMVPLVLCADAS